MDNRRRRAQFRARDPNQQRRKAGDGRRTDVFLKGLIYIVTQVSKKFRYDLFDKTQCFFGWRISGIFPPFRGLEFLNLFFGTPWPSATALIISVNVPLIGGIIFCGRLILVFELGFYMTVA